MRARQYRIVNIRVYLDKNKLTYIGEEKIYELISDFSCPKNPDVQHFLLHNAIEFAKKNQSVTYLVFDADDASVAGYFSIAIKPISIYASSISRRMAKKLKRVSILDKDSQSYTTVAYLIAQLGKNYAIPRECRIDGGVLLGFVLETVSELQYAAGGIMEFLECENNDFLMDFYARNQFKFFNVRITEKTAGNTPHQLNQLLKLI